MGVEEAAGWRLVVARVKEGWGEEKGATGRRPVVVGWEEGVVGAVTGVVVKAPVGGEEAAAGAGWAKA